MVKLIKGVGVFAIVGALLSSGCVSAQVQVNLTGNYLTSAETGSSVSDGLWGGGATVRYFIKPKLAIGLNGRYFTRSESVSFDPGNGLGTSSVEVSANLLLVTAQVDYFFGESALRPYAGLEAGLYRGTGKVEIATGGTSVGSGSTTTNNAGVAPKIGLQYAITPAIGVNVDAGLHLIFSDGEIGKTALFGAGVFYTFGQ